MRLTPKDCCLLGADTLKPLRPSVPAALKATSACREVTREA